MDEEDFRALIDVLEDELRGVDAAALADERHYLREDEDGVGRLVAPQKRLIEMLSAFDRKLAIEDRHTFVEALTIINGALGGSDRIVEGVRGAVVELAADEDRDARFVDLSQAPDLAEIRAATHALIGQLLETRLPPTEIG